LSDNENVTTTVLLICREGESRKVYQAELGSAGVLLVCVQGLMEFFRRGVYCPLNGILVDMPTYMRSSEEEKRLMTELVGLFPALRLKCNEPTGEIRTLPFGTVYPGNIAPAVFVQKYCTTVAPRKIRTSERHQMNLPALLSKPLPDGNVSDTKTVTANISNGGCFLVGFEPWTVGDRGWLTFPEFNDNTPVQVEVCSVLPWGESRSLPGMGFRFVALTPVQKVELKNLCGQSFMQDEE
jgi:hypothetical protein